MAYRRSYRRARRAYGRRRPMSFSRRRRRRGRRLGSSYTVSRGGVRL